ncbi:MAG: hypothetical protein Q9166_007469 [cf. Caloplaca sp. 2 TL-2023]
MASTPHVIQSREIPSSLHHTTRNAEKASNPPTYNPFQSQSQHAQPLPQFGSHLPITPSTTPSNSGSQKQAPSPTNHTHQNMAADQPLAVESIDKSEPTSKISQEYKDWCNRTRKTLEEEADPSALPQSLSDHLINNFNNPAFADCELYISHVSHRFEPAVVSLHSLLIAQNSTLLGLLNSAEMREDGKRQMLLSVKDQYATPAALKYSIRTCYGEGASQYTCYPGELASELETSIAWMNNALAIAAAGHLLGMTGVAHRGEQTASVVLNWDNLERALSFAMDTNVQRAWGSSNSSSSFPCNASELLLSCLYFVISNVSESIRLDLAAKPLIVINRFPLTPDSEAPSSRSHLSRIQFGNLPVQTEEPSSKDDTLTSRILLSLPFTHLKFIVDRVSLSVNTKVAEPVVQERERRRLRALNATTSKSQADPEHNPTLTQKERIVKADDKGESRFSVEIS